MLFSYQLSKRLTAIGDIKYYTEMSSSSLFSHSKVEENFDGDGTSSDSDNAADAAAGGGGGWEDATDGAKTMMDILEQNYGTKSLPLSDCSMLNSLDCEMNDPETKRSFDFNETLVESQAVALKKWNSEKFVNFSDENDDLISLNTDAGEKERDKKFQLDEPKLANDKPRSSRFFSKVYSYFRPDLSESIPSSNNRQVFLFGRGENVKLKVLPKQDADQLGLSARLTYRGVILKLHNEGALMTAGKRFVATVEVANLEALNGCNNFEHAKSELLSQLRIVTVLRCGLTARITDLRAELLVAVEGALGAADSSDSESFRQLLQVMEKCYQNGTFSYDSFKAKLTSSRKSSEALKALVRELAELEEQKRVRDEIMASFGLVVEDSKQEIANKLNQLRQYNMEKRRTLLLEKAPPILRNHIENLSTHDMVLIHVNDVKLFVEMTNLLDKELFQRPLKDLANRWIRQIKATKDYEPSTASNAVFFCLCKSLQELLYEIADKCQHSLKELFVSNTTGWHPIPVIGWNLPSDITQCLEREYYFVFKLLHYFDPSSCVVRKPFQYKVTILSDIVSLKATGTGMTNDLGVSDEIYVWYCLLDDVLGHVLTGILSQFDDEMSVFTTLLEGYVRYICNVGRNELESVRVVTHNTARFIIQTAPNLKLLEKTSCDRQMLLRQLDIVNTVGLQINQSINDFRDVMDIFNSYWHYRYEIVEQLPTQLDLPKMHQIKQQLLSTALGALEKKASVENYVSFLRSYNDFLIDLKDMQFSWFIKLNIGEKQISALEALETIELVDNQWSDTERKTFLVLDTKKFVQIAPAILSTEAIPKHYVAEIVDSLLGFIKTQLDRAFWQDDSALSTEDQLTTTGELISVIRTSLLYLDEQSDYVSFELFYDESVKPFASIMQGCNSLASFNNRIHLIREAFWFIRKQNEMDIDRALQLFREENPSSESDNERLLRTAYDRYLTCFQEFMQMAVDNDEETVLNNIVEKVLQMTNKIHFTEWCESIKLKKLPAMLAGLAAVWSILVSKDVSGTGKYLSPHCIQVICLLRLLSADRVELGVAKHLAQVLTGQGKSLILALCAALLALMGHDVLVVCYNRYLLERDAADFKQLFSIFGVAERIQYGTFEDLANSVLTSSVDGQRIGLREMVTDLISQDEMNHRMTAKVKSKHNMVLLMDEVDVFFTNEFYGNDYYPVANPMITGLGRIQQEIWKAVSEKCYDPKVLTTRITKYIKSFVNYEVFEEFLAASNRYDLLVYQDSNILGLATQTWQLKSYTNRTLFDEHLQCMLQCAIEVHREPKSRWTNYKLSSRDTITFRYRGEYTNHRRESYYSTFNYFRLKKDGFCSETNGELNYGYLNIDCGSLSYAMLPKSFALILGVSGTLTTLNEPEQQTIKELYDINQMSVLPTFFGCSNLCFDASGDFYHLPTVGDWMECICSHTQEVVASKRAVIVFFSTEEVLHKFKCNYSGRFDRLNVLTENTEESFKRQYINEAGIPRTVTLATRGMGRGVDYKSSVAVERNGGVHVIQTFFSLDIREETQIRGRTARKDNKGSYELVVCESDLMNSGVVRVVTNEDDISYDKLNEIRTKLLLEGNGKTYKAIKQASVKHEITMKYLESLLDSTILFNMLAV